MAHQDLGTLIATGVKTAAVHILQERGIRGDVVDAEKLSRLLRAEGPALVTRILDQGKALLDGGQSGWLETLVKVECVDSARRVVDSYVAGSR